MKVIFYAACLFLFAVQCRTQTEDLGDAGEPEQNEAIILDCYETFIDHAWNRKDMDSLRAVSAESYIRTLNGIQVAGNQSEMEANMKVYFTGFPDGHLTLGSTIIKDSLLVSKWNFRGTNTGIFGEKPPTGKRVDVSGFSEIFFDSNGKMIREDIYYNELELLQQLGYTLVPPDLD